MKSRLLVLFGLFLMVIMSLSGSVASAASLSPRPVSSHALSPHPDTVVDTMCLNTSDSECFNLESCNLDNPIQVYGVTQGGNCTDRWNITYTGNTVTDVGENYPFYCGDDLNAKYFGDKVWQAIYNFNTDQYVPSSDGGGEPAYVQLPNTDYEGFLVQVNSNDEDSRFIDVSTTCQEFGTVEYVYAGCKTNGCLVRESPAPPSLSYWSMLQWTFSPERQTVASARSTR